MSTSSDLEYWHRTLARVLGLIAVALARRKANPQKLASWAAILERVAADMRRQKWRE